MSKFGFVFPGQGSQLVGMGKELYENYEVAKNIFDKANELLDFDLIDICFNGPEEELKKTQYTQPAILVTSIAALEVLRTKTDIKPAFVAGHSLGEYTALYAAGVLSLEDVVKLVAKRGSLMGEATGGSMAAILAPQEIAESAVEEAQSAGMVSVANYNTPEQFVITGEVDAVNKACEIATQKGAKRAIVLPVSGAFHSALMKGASIEFEKAVETCTLNDAKVPVLTNVDAKETVSADEFKSKMPQQIYSSVYWTQTINKMLENEVSNIIEIGPNKVLMGMNRKISRDITSFNVGDLNTLETTVEKINNQGVLL